MTEQIELAVGQTWLCEHGTKSKIVAISHGYVCYWIAEENGMWSELEHLFKKDSCHKLVPKTVRKSQCVIRYPHTDTVSDELFIDADTAQRHYRSETVIQWPLVVNGVEQWVEIPE